MTITDAIINEVKKVIHGKDSCIKLTLAALIAGGHVLLEDIPGVGKTTMATAFARAMSLDYKRMQFTPDVLPSDLVGFNIYDKGNDSFRFLPGCIYTNLFLADEINRTSPKTQSALLEVMEEGNASVEGVTRALPKPFFVIATENPYGSSGTQKLPESQLDRFLICISMGYPDHESAQNILKSNSSVNIDVITPVAGCNELLNIQAAVKDIFVEDRLFDYIVTLTEATRNPNLFSLGLSPRGSIAILKMAKAMAFLNNRNYVIPEDIHDIFLATACHRVHISPRQKAAGKDLQELLLLLLKQYNPGV